MQIRRHAGESKELALGLLQLFSELKRQLKTDSMI